MNIELELRSIKNELSKKSLFDMNIERLLFFKKNIDKYFSDHPFDSVKIPPKRTNYFNSVKLFEHKEDKFSIMIIDENPEIIRKDGKKKLAPNHDKINAPAFLIEYDNLEIKLKPSLDKNTDENFKMTVFLAQKNLLKNYLFLNDEVKSVVFDKQTKIVKRMVSYRLEKEQWVSALFSNSCYKNLKYYDKMKKEIGYGIIEYSVVRHYYELKFHAIAFYFQDKIREKLDYKSIERIKNNKTPLVPFRFKTIIKHLKENIPKESFKSDCVLLKGIGLTKETLDDIFDLAELKYTN